MKNKNDLKRIFNMNNILTQILEFGAYFVLIGSILLLAYLSFIDSFEGSLDLKVLGIFSAATVFSSWMCWNMFYRKQYEKVMSDDIAQQSLNKYSIHSRYYVAIKDWKDADLQIAIDKFNDEYTKKWLNWVERITGVPIKSKKEKYVDSDTGEEKIIEEKGIEELPYKGFKHKLLMFRIKHRKYPESGYKTSMELMSLFSYQDANFNKRELKADKKFYKGGSIKKLIVSLLLITTGASLTPVLIAGNYETVILRLMLAIGSLLSSTFMGAMNGVKGARIKLSIVEDVCADLERWANKKPILAPYEEPKAINPDLNVENSNNENEVTNEIFNVQNLQNK